ncbi:MAG: PilN domain-containing protein [Pseudomonadota bacterium]
MSNIQANNQWSILGYDPRLFFRQWKEAWSSLLFDRASPLRARLDVPLCLHRPQENVLVLGDRHLDGSPDSASFHAWLLPDDIVLAQTLRVPLSVDAEVEGVVDFELAARNPFPPDDTVSGWREVSRDDGFITIAVAIASRAALASWIASRQHKETDGELWAAVGEHYVALRGYGGTAYAEAYKATLRRVGLKAFAAVALLLVCALLFVAYRHNEASALRDSLTAVETRAQRAMTLRNELAEANGVIDAATSSFSQYRNPHIELERLTRSLDDAAFLTHFSMREDKVRVRGRADDAAQVMQTLAEHPAYASVSAPQAIATVGRTEIEQFYLDLELRPAGSAEQGSGQ